MSHKSGFARRVITAGLAAAMAFGAVAPATVALAEGTGSITITQEQGNVTTFDGYQIFTGKVVDGTSGKTVENIAWKDDTTKGAVEAAIKQVDASYAGTSAQDAAEWLVAKLTGTSATTMVDSATIADYIAHQLSGAGLTPTVVRPGKASSLDAGYWLFVTTPGTLNDNGAKGESGTSPILAVVGGDAVTVKEKAKPVTSTKQIQSDATGAWGQVADSQRGQQVNYKITGTVAGNVNTFDTYYYEFHDSISKGLTTDTSAVKVKMYASQSAADADPNGEAGTEVTSSFDVALADGTDGAHELSVKCENLKGIDGATVTKDTVVVVYYSSTLNGDAVIGSTGNPNTASVEYSNNPYSTDHGTTQPNTPKDYTYKLHLAKVDRNSEVALAGAKFTIQATGADDTASTGKYVQADGSLGDDAYEFETDANGYIDVAGLDAGTYTVSETAAPSGYAPVDAFTFKITPSYDGTTLSSLGVTVSGTEGQVIAGPSNGTTGDNALVATTDTSDDADTTTGTVKVTVGDAKQVGLPLTGQSGLMVTVLVGGAIVATSVVALNRRSKQDDVE